jgi:sulfite reductase beta subunit-like hemoprotein
MSSDLESLKAESRHLRGTLKEELATADPSFSTDSQHLLKPHGLYQQKDRDRRGEVPAPLPALMVRGRIPAGRLSSEAWLAWDEIADRFGDGSLRITTRQSLELHGVLKGELKDTLQALRDALQTSQGACGDVVRNVLAPPNPWRRSDLRRITEEAVRISDHYKAKSRAYAEVFLDGEAVDPRQEEEPVYGATYLPRKFKVALTVVGENAVDLFTHDLALAATFEGESLTGWHLFVGGGMGMTHGNANTFPRLADHLGWVPHDALLQVTDAVVTAYRDSGDRTNRKRARLKYVLHDRGVEWFRAEVEARSGVVFQARALPPWSTPSTLGWQSASDGSWSFGLHTLSGRIAGDRKHALREAVATFHLEVQLTQEQDLILLGISDAARPALERLLAEHNVSIDAPTALASRALACVALPWCGLAVAEAERSLPHFLDLLQSSLDRFAPNKPAPTFRVTGCANGCARPYAAEIALVGQTPDRYVLWAGGNAEGTRLAFPVLEKVPTSELSSVFDRLVSLWAEQGAPEESLGAFAHRLRPAALAQALTLAPAES